MSWVFHLSYWSKHVTRFERERLAANLAEAIYDIFHTATRSSDRQLALTAKQTSRAMLIAWKAGVEFGQWSAWEASRD